MTDRHEVILDALTSRSRTTNQLANICNCTAMQASLRCAELSRDGKIWRSGNGLWMLSVEERARRPWMRLKDADLVPVYEELRIRNSARSIHALAAATGLESDDVERRLLTLKSQGMVAKSDSGKGWELTRVTATRDPSPFPPPWWDTPEVGLWG